MALQDETNLDVSREYVGTSFQAAFGNVGIVHQLNGIAAVDADVAVIVVFAAVESRPVAVLSVGEQHDDVQVFLLGGLLTNLIIVVSQRTVPAGAATKHGDGHL